MFFFMYVIFFYPVINVFYTLINVFINSNKCFFMLYNKCCYIIIATIVISFVSLISALEDEKNGYLKKTNGYTIVK